MKKAGEYILRGLMAAFGSLPLRVQYFNAHILAWLLLHVFRYRVDVVRDNLVHAFPEKTEKELSAIVGDTYRHLGDIIVEAIWFGRCKNPKRLKKAGIVRIANPEVLNELYPKSHGVISLYTHCGNWELLGGIEHYTEASTPMTRENTCFVYKKMKSEMWDRIMHLNRCAPVDGEAFPGYVESMQLVRHVFTHREQGMFYNINTDQRPYVDSPANIDVSFMGRIVKTMTAGAALAHKFSMSVCYLGMRRLSRGHYELVYVPICEDASKMEVADIMNRYYELLEEDIKADPANYLWTHKRWKWAKK